MKRFFILIVIVISIVLLARLGYKYQHKKDVEKFMNSIYKTPKDLEEKYGVKLVEVGDWKQDKKRKKKDEKKRTDIKQNEARKRLESILKDENVKIPIDMRVVLKNDIIIVDNYHFYNLIKNDQGYESSWLNEFGEKIVEIEKIDWDELFYSINKPIFIYREIPIKNDLKNAIKKLVKVADEIGDIKRIAASVNPNFNFNGLARIAVDKDVLMSFYNKVVSNLLIKSYYSHFDVVGEKDGEFHTIYHQNESWRGYRSTVNILLKVNYSESRDSVYLSGYDDRQVYLLKDEKGASLIENSEEVIYIKFVKSFVEENIDKRWLKKIPFEMGSLGRIVAVFDDPDDVKFKEVVPFMRAVDNVFGVHLDYCDSGNTVIKSYGTISFDEYKEKRKGKVLNWRCLHKMDPIRKLLNGIDCDGNISTKDIDKSFWK